MLLTNPYTLPDKKTAGTDRRAKNTDLPISALSKQRAKTLRKQSAVSANNSLGR